MSSSAARAVALDQRTQVKTCARWDNGSEAGMVLIAKTDVVLALRTRLTPNSTWPR